jgi:competence protein ComFC
MGYRGCPDCRNQVQKVPEPVGEACGLPQRLAGLCMDCKTAVPPSRMMRSWLVFDGPIWHALHSLKHRWNIALGDTLAHHLVEFVTALGWPGDAVVPIPLVKNRMKERGYNQAGLVAMPLDSIRH